MGGAVAAVAFQAPPKELSQHILQARPEHIFLVTEDGDRISAVHLRSPRQVRRVVLYSHSNAEDVGLKLSFLDRMVDICATEVLAYDYCGYGLSDGTPTEENCYAAIDAAYAYLRREFDPSNIVTFGRSIGSGPSIDLNSRHPEIRGMVLQSPMESGAKAFLGNAGAWVGYQLDIFRNYEKIGDIACPVLFMHGLADEVVPFSNAKALYDACPNAVNPLWIDGRGHNNLPTDIVLQRVREFLDDLEGLGWGFKHFRAHLQTNLSVNL
mmetsp:Transcript_19453/g.35265  ORF Transcript_19453/g.35265 Transcript_19453/m.35265 type:complete len:267 (+) Transcript_19453:100-900(+)